jgi:hypothetical protein
MTAIVAIVVVESELAKLNSFKASYLPPVRYLQNLKELIITIRFFPFLYLLTEDIPKLVCLKKLTVAFSLSIFSSLGDDDQYPSIERLTEKIASSNTIREVNFVKLTDSRISVKSDVDVRAEKLLLTLLYHIEEITFEGSTLRTRSRSLPNLTSRFSQLSID